MTKTQIEYILALAKLKNFGKAADQCYITQSTLSAMVAKFEQQIDVPIFNRKTRPISITEKGEQVIKSLKSIYREFQLLDELVQEIKGYEVGNINISCIPTVAAYLYPLILNNISLEYPKVNFKIHELTTENTVEQIMAGSIDIGIASIPLHKNDIIEYPLYSEDFILYDCGHKLKKTKYKVTDIDLKRLWLMEEGHCLRNQVGKICDLRQKSKFKGNLSYNCGSIFTLLEMVKINAGVTLLPRLALINNPQIEQENIYAISAPTPTRNIGIITHKNYNKQRVLSKLISIINTTVNEHLPKSKGKKIMVKPF